MVVASLVLKFCVLSGLIFLSRITSNFANVPFSTSPLQTIDFDRNTVQGHPVKNDGAKRAMDTTQSKKKISIIKKFWLANEKTAKENANNRQTLYPERQNNGHSNPVRNSKQMKRLSVRDFHKRKNQHRSFIHESATVTINMHPPNLAFHHGSDDQVKHIIRNKRSNGQYTFGIDKFVYVLTKLNNVLNSNTNNRQLNRFTLAFNNFFTSPGLNAFNVFYTLLADYWTVVDAVANIFRFNEARIRDQIKRNQDQNQPDPLGDLQTELDDTNTNLEEIAELVSGVAAERVEIATGDEFDRSGVKKKKKKKKKKKSGTRQKKPSFATTSQPTSHFYKPATNGSEHHIQPIAIDRWQPIDRNKSPTNPQSPVESNRHVFDPENNNANRRSQNTLPTMFQPSRLFYKPATHGIFDGSDHHIQPTASDTWQPIDRNRSPINPQSQVESIRHVYYPVSYGSNNMNSRQYNSVPLSTMQTNLFSPVSRRVNNDFGGLQRQMNPKPLSISVDQFAINYNSNRIVNRWNHMQFSSYSASKNDYRKNRRPNQMVFNQ